jgi:hypothetical protein
VGKAGRKRLIVELAATAVELVVTAIASPLLILLLDRADRAGGWTILFYLELPFLPLTHVVMVWINSTFPFQVVRWLNFWSDLLPLYIPAWMILFALVKLLEGLIHMKKREA